MKKIAVFGSTGSIGKSTLRVVQHLPTEFQVYALAAHSNVDLLQEQIRQFKPKIVSIYDSTKAALLQSAFPDLRIVCGDEGLEEIAADPAIDFVVMAIVGMQALKPTIQAIRAKKTVGIANKEVLVSAGEFITKLAKQESVKLLPIDSEHSALFQCLEGKKREEINRIVLTASGGPFRNYNQERLAHVTLEDALAHPNWKMGPKVTIDSSTLLNKGLEMIEARWLFDFDPKKIEVVIHPQSIIHSLVECIDGSILAQMSEPDMIYPIQYAMTYPERLPGLFPPFDFVKNHQLTFATPDTSLFPALKLAQECMIRGESYPTFLNAANEVLVKRFIKKEISWNDIASLLDKLLTRHQAVSTKSLEIILNVDQEARKEAQVA